MSNIIAEPVCEEVEVVGHILLGDMEGGEWEDNDFEPDAAAFERLQEVMYNGAPQRVPVMTVTQHERLLEEAKQGQRVLVHELESVKADNAALQRALEVWLELDKKRDDKLRTMLAAAPAPVQAEPASPWVRVMDQPPKKGEDVLVWCYDTKEQFVAFSLGDGRFQFGIGQDGIILACRPTYWQPLPKAPYQPGYDFSDLQLEGV